MTTSIVDADSLLAVDIGTVTTRAMLFDVVEGRYRFLAAGSAPSTATAPYNDVTEGVQKAIDQLQAITGRTLVDDNERLIIPTAPNGSGVDSLAATISAGPALKVLVVGLLEDVSQESAVRLAHTTYVGALQKIGMHDQRQAEANLEMILKLRPDLILVAGGTEAGATQSVLKLLEPVGLACYLMPEGIRPEVIYAGNSALQDQVEAMLGKILDVHYASNVRPSLEHEQLEPAQLEVAESTVRIRSRQIAGVNPLSDLAKGNLTSGAYGFGRLVRFLSKAYGSSKGVMGVDLGASGVTLAAAFDGELCLRIHPTFGNGDGKPDVLPEQSLQQVIRWMSMDLPEEQVREYLFNKALYPTSIPETIEELAIEQATAKAAMRAAVRQVSAGFPEGHPSPGPGLLPSFEPILAAGSTLVRAPTLGNSMLMLLDGLQPTGVTTLVLDQNYLSPVLGAAAAVNPLLAVQVLDSSTFQYLGTVISPVSSTRPGTPVLRVKMVYASGHETTLDVKQGSLETLPLSLGQSAQIHLQPLHRSDVGMGGPGRGGKLKVQGGALGVVIDARGRPLRLPENAIRRTELFKKWLWTLGG